MGILSDHGGFHNISLIHRYFSTRYERVKARRRTLSLSSLTCTPSQHRTCSKASEIRLTSRKALSSFVLSLSNLFQKESAFQGSHQPRHDRRTCSSAPLNPGSPYSSVPDSRVQTIYAQCVIAASAHASYVPIALINPTKFCMKHQRTSVQQFWLSGRGS